MIYIADVFIILYCILFNLNIFISYNSMLNDSDKDWNDDCCNLGTIVCTQLKVNIH